MSKQVEIRFPDGSKKKFDAGISALDVAKSISEGLARASLACKVNDELKDMTTTITTNCDFQLLTFRDEEGKKVLWHSAAHVLAMAAKELYPEIKLTIGPAIDGGFYYDFDIDNPFTPEDLKKLEEKMKEIVKREIPFEKEIVSKEKAKEIMKKRGEPYKIEMIDEFDDKEVTLYKNNDFIDPCRGPHVPNTKYVKALKLTKTGGAYWKGDAKNKMLQRVYGIAFSDKKELKEYLKMMEEAEKRDHRKIGKELELFSFHQEAPGMPFFHDKGSYIWDKLVDFTTKIMKDRDYEINKTPIILNDELWKRSGHWDHYKDNMYSTNIDEQDFAVKPMNCPGNMLIFKTKMHSYRDLPIRAGEFGLVHRHELSGVLSGLFRVRCFTQDDAHVFCTEDQIKSEIEDLIDFIDKVYTTFGFDYHMELSTKPEKAMGDPKMWTLAENILEDVLKHSGKEYIVNPGDGAFYGPKIDFHLKDAIGRTWQCGTIQLDFQMPEKFDLTYEGSDGQKHRPVMLHRAILGSVERFMGVLIEHYAGKLPFWINPNQIKILTIADRHKDYADELRTRFKRNGLRVEIDSRSETIPKKVREAQLDQFNYILVIGDKEIEDNTVSVRTRDNVVEGAIKVDELIERFKKEIADYK